MIDTVQLDTDGKPGLVLGRSPNGPDNLDDDPGPLLGGAAVRVRPAVRVRRQELRQQVPVRRVDLDAVEPGLGRQTGGARKLGHDRLNFGDGELARGAEDQGAQDARQEAGAE